MVELDPLSLKVIEPLVYSPARYSLSYSGPQHWYTEYVKNLNRGRMGIKFENKMFIYYTSLVYFCYYKNIYYNYPFQYIIVMYKLLLIYL